MEVDGIRGQLLLSTKVDPQCIVILDTKIYVLAGFKSSTFFVWSLFSYYRPCDILRRKKNIHLYSRGYFKISQDYDHIGGAAMVKWYSPPTNVTRVRSPDPLSYEVRVCCLFSLDSLVFLPPQKPALLNSNWISYTRTL